MGLEHGTYQEFDQAFAKKHNVVVTQYGDKVNISKHSLIQICPIYGDCTAASIYTATQGSDYFFELLPIVLQYLSCSGRISCFFSRKIPTGDATKEIELLRKFNIAGLNVQYSNRCSKDAYVMISGILKIPNPYVRYQYNGLNAAAAELSVQHDHFNSDEYVKLNQHFVGVYQ